jgi:hypothetical protein
LLVLCATLVPSKSGGGGKGSSSRECTEWRVTVLLFSRIAAFHVIKRRFDGRLPETLGQHFCARREWHVVACVFRVESQKQITNSFVRLGHVFPDLFVFLFEETVAIVEKVDGYILLKTAMSQLKRIMDRLVRRL